MKRQQDMNRRSFLYGLGASLGSVAFTDMLARAQEEDLKSSVGPHHQAKAKACIMLFMEGAPSHIDTFDPKPKLDELHLKSFERSDKKFSGMTNGNRFFLFEVPTSFAPLAINGVEMCEHFVHLADSSIADELCVYKGCQVDSVNHPSALYQMNTGSRFGGDPAIGAWMNYGLGSENENLPGYVVMTELAAPQGGSGNWSSGFLPPHFQGTRLRSGNSPILDLHPPEWKSRAHQRANLDLINQLNRQAVSENPGNQQLQSRIENYELAFRMQLEVPDLVDLSSESATTQSMYGLDNSETEVFGRKLLLARRLVENGVRFVQVFSGGWDSHDFIERAHRKRIRSVDQPIAALIKDLKERGMLDDTLVVWTGEFGRTPDNTVRGGEQAIGRDHNNEGMCMFSPAVE